MSDPLAQTNQTLSTCQLLPSAPQPPNSGGLSAQSPPEYVLDGRAARGGDVGDCEDSNGSREDLVGVRPSDALSVCVQNLGLTTIERHIFLCADQSKPLCCSQAEGLATWDYLKRRLRELGLDSPTPERPTSIFRTKANCLRVCQQGPILVVYPDGVWYHSVTPEVMEQIIQTHLMSNQVVQEYVFCAHALPKPQCLADQKSG